jgi:uncharacterized RDD family membrane protein YckC
MTPENPQTPQSPDNANPYAPPTARVDDIAPVYEERELAERLTRLWAALIDGAIQLLIAVPLTIFVLGGYSDDPGVIELARNTLIGALLFLALNGVLLARHGQTIGKRLMKIRIVRSNGRQASLAHLLALRYLPVWLVTVIPVVGIAIVMINPLFIFRDSRKCLHDNIADTIVIKA